MELVSIKIYNCTFFYVEVEKIKNPNINIFKINSIISNSALHLILFKKIIRAGDDTFWVEGFFEF